MPSNVVLPAPLAPSNPVTPAPTVKVAPLRTGVAPHRFTSWSATTTGSATYSTLPVGFGRIGPPG